jgi:hypothetical protein
LEPHDENVKMLEEALRTYKRSRVGGRKRKAAKEAALPMMDEGSTLPATLEVSDEEVQEEAAEAGMVGAERVRVGRAQDM